MAKSKIILIPLVITVFIASILCCCLSHLSQAQAKSVASVSHVPECHRHMASKTAPREAPVSDECKCHKVISLAIQKTTIDIQLTELEGFSPNKSLAGILFDSHVIDRQTDLALAQAPPGLLSGSTPLYLQHSNLRL